MDMTMALKFLHGENKVRYSMFSKHGIFDKNGMFIGQNMANLTIFEHLWMLNLSF